MNIEVLVSVEEADGGGCVATAPSQGIVTQAEPIDELHAQARDALAGRFDAQHQPQRIGLQFVQDEVFAA